MTVNTEQTMTTDIQSRFPSGVKWSRRLDVDQKRGPYSEAASQVISKSDARDAYREVSSWPEYQHTQLHRLGKLESHLGCGAIHYKDESTRFGLGSFKALGGAYAVLRYVAAEYLHKQGKQVALGDVRQGGIKDFASSLTVVTATDGNHGRSVAWGAKNAGCPCRIYIHCLLYTSPSPRD